MHGMVVEEQEDALPSDRGCMEDAADAVEAIQLEANLEQQVLIKN